MKISVTQITILGTNQLENIFRSINKQFEDFNTSINFISATFGLSIETVRHIFISFNFNSRIQVTNQYEVDILQSLGSEVYYQKYEYNLEVTDKFLAKLLQYDCDVFFKYIEEVYPEYEQFTYALLHKLYDMKI